MGADRWKQAQRKKAKKRRSKEERKDSKETIQIALEKALTTSSTASEGRPALKTTETELPENNEWKSPSDFTCSLGDAFPAL